MNLTRVFPYEELPRPNYLEGNIENIPPDIAIENLRTLARSFEQENCRGIRLSTTHPMLFRLTRKRDEFSPEGIVKRVLQMIYDSFAIYQQHTVRPSTNSPFPDEDIFKVEEQALLGFRRFVEDLQQNRTSLDTNYHNADTLYRDLDKGRRALNEGLIQGRRAPTSEASLGTVYGVVDAGDLRIVDVDTAAPAVILNPLDTLGRGSSLGGGARAPASVVPVPARESAQSVCPPLFQPPSRRVPVANISSGSGRSACDCEGCCTCSGCGNCCGGGDCCTIM